MRKPAVKTHNCIILILFCFTLVIAFPEMGLSWQRYAHIDTAYDAYQISLDKFVKSNNHAPHSIFNQVMKEAVLRPDKKRDISHVNVSQCANKTKKMAKKCERMIGANENLEDILNLMGETAHFIQDMNCPHHAIGFVKAWHRKFEVAASYGFWSQDKFDGFNYVVNYKRLIHNAARFSKRYIRYDTPSFYSDDGYYRKVMEPLWDHTVNDVIDLWLTILYNGLGEKRYKSYGLPEKIGERAKTTIRYPDLIGDELVADFGRSGLWHYSGSTWSKKKGSNPKGDLTDWVNGIAVDYGASGLYGYDGTSWSKLNEWNSEGLERWSGGLASDFGHKGIWNHDGNKWKKLKDQNPAPMGMVDWNNGLAVDFDAKGLWNYNGKTWSKLSNKDPEYAEDWSAGLVADFGLKGLWNHDGRKWKKLIDLNPQDFEGCMGVLFVDFDDSGLSYYGKSGWIKLTGTDWNPRGMTCWAGGLAVDFGAKGLWNYNLKEWTKKTSWDPETMCALENGLTVDFGDKGLWNYSWSTWNKLSHLDLKTMIEVDLY